MGLPAKELTLLGSGGSNPLISATQIPGECARDFVVFFFLGLSTRQV